MPVLQDDQDEQEAQRKRRFLEEGAEVQLEPVFDYPPAAVTLTAPRSVTVELPRTGDVTDRLAREPDTEPLVVIELGRVETVPDFMVLVFLNSPDASSRSTAADPGYLGTVGFFHGGHAGHAEAEPMRVRLPARRALERAGTGEALTVTLVPVGHPGRRLTPQGLDVAATMQLVRSEIG